MANKYLDTLELACLLFFGDNDFVGERSVLCEKFMHQILTRLLKNILLMLKFDHANFNLLP